MTQDERWQRVKELFQSALDQPAEQRQAWLDEACAGDDELRAQLAEMLRLHAQEDSLLDNPPTIDVIDEVAARASAEREGEVIDHYKLLRMVGEGGMGVVWLAEQTEPVRRKVALKILKAGMDTKQVLARFEMERNVLALMDHPGIARVFDAGETEQGRSYFVMEYVEGLPIHEFCDVEKLTTGERLRLFMLVCDAVHHAHQKGIIHRDLKPSNILVVLQDGQPAPKVIDFGIAKATGVSLTEHTLFTEEGQLIGTPEYMSPEQSEMTGIGVDTTTDIYSLGVVLYQLLTGVLPFDPETFRSKGIGEIQRIIHEEEPEKPSTRLSTLGEATATIVSQRGTDAKALRRELKGDLDWITMKAMAKERTRRYASAHGLATDILRHLSHEPVVAGPPGAAYRVRKFVRRHRFGAATAAIVVVVLVAGIVTSTSFAVGQTRARAVAAGRAAELETVTAFQQSMLTGIDVQQMGLDIVANLRKQIEEALTDRAVADEAARDLLASFDQAVALVNSTVMATGVLDQNLLVRAVETIEEELGDQPVIEAPLRRAVGLTYQSIGLRAQASPQLERALELRRRELGNDDPHTLDSVADLGLLLTELWSYEEADPYTREALDGRRRILGNDDPDTLTSVNNMGYLLGSWGRYEEAEPYYREALEHRLEVLGDDHRDTLVSLNNLAALLQLMEEYDEAEKHLSKALKGCRRVLGNDHPYTLLTVNNMGMFLQSTERLDDAGPYFREAEQGCRSVLGDLHPQTLLAINNMGFWLAKKGRLEEAEPYYREALAGRRRMLTAGHPDLLGSIHNEADILRELGQYEEAEVLAAEAVEGVRQSLPAGHLYGGLILANHGKCLLKLERYAEAESTLQEAYTILENAAGPQHPRTLAAAEALIGLYDSWHEAEPDLGYDAKAAEWRAKLPTPQEDESENAD